MRGIIWEEVQRVDLVAAHHPQVQRFLRWRDRRIRERLEATFHERQQERQRLQALFGVPFERLLTLEALVEQYSAHVAAESVSAPLAPPTCRECRHCAGDKYHPGAYVCWEGWRGGPPRRLSTLIPCTAFTESRPQAQAPTWWSRKQALEAFLAAHGIRYHAGRWQAHQHDLAREAGTWGFAVGTQWERDVRAWLTTCYGPRFFVPHRWLLVTDCAGATHYREVDGIERVSATEAFVYEIKHRTPGYTQLMEEYIPLLRRAYPDRVFTPIEINADNPYRASFGTTPPPVRLLGSLDERTMDGHYQLLVLAEIPQDARVLHLAGNPN